MVYYNYNIGKDIETNLEFLKRENKINEISNRVGFCGLILSAGFSHTFLKNRNILKTSLFGMGGYLLFKNYIYSKMDKKLKHDKNINN